MTFQITKEEVMGQPAISFELKLLREQYYTAGTTNLSSYECIKWLNHKLTDAQRRMFRDEVCFGFLMDMREMALQAKLLHNCLLHELKTYNV